MSRKIFICCTFREFDGNDNDKIQREFLKSLEKQTYRNFELIVTNFREKNVENTLKEFDLNFHYLQSRIDCPISFTLLIENALPFIKKGENILLWTNADMMFPENFLQTVIDEYEPGFSGTCFPQRIFASIADYKNNNAIYDYESAGVNYREEKHWRDEKLSGFYQIDPNHWLPDIIFIDADNLLTKDFQKPFFKFRMDEHWPGMIQNLMLGFFNKKGAPRKNIIYKSQIGEILNNYANSKNPSKEDHIQAKIEQFKNTPLLISAAKTYCLSMKLNKKFHVDNFFAKLNQLESYKVVGSKQQIKDFKKYCKHWREKYQKLMKTSGLITKIKDEIQTFRKTKLKRLREKIRAKKKALKQFFNKKNNVTKTQENPLVIAKQKIEKNPPKYEMEFHPPHFRPLPETGQELNLREVIWNIQRNVRDPQTREKITNILALQIKNNISLDPLPETEETMKLTAELINNGYVDLPNILTPAECDDIINYLAGKEIVDFYNNNDAFTLDNIPPHTFMGRFTPDIIMNAPHIMKFINNPTILKVAEGFLGAPPTLSVAIIMYSLANGIPPKEMQLFHRDSDDFKFCKAFTYLSDVLSDDDGPHILVKNSATYEQVVESFRKKNGRSPDDKEVKKLFEMRRYGDEEIHSSFPEDQIYKVLGKKGSSFMENVFNIHRGTEAKNGHRILLQCQFSLMPTPLFTYTPKEHDLVMSDYESYVNRLYFNQSNKVLRS